MSLVRVVNFPFERHKILLGNHEGFVGTGLLARVRTNNMKHDVRRRGGEIASLG